MHNHDKFPHHSHIVSRKPEFLEQGRVHTTLKILVDTLTPLATRGPQLIKTASNEYMQVVVVVLLLHIFSRLWTQAHTTCRVIDRGIFTSSPIWMHKSWPGGPLMAGHFVINEPC